MTDNTMVRSPVEVPLVKLTEKSCQLSCVAGSPPPEATTVPVLSVPRTSEMIPLGELSRSGPGADQRLSAYKQYVALQWPHILIDAAGRIAIEHIDPAILIS